MQEAIISQPALTGHAETQMARRRIDWGRIQAVINYGRAVHVRGALIHAVGRREIKEKSLVGIDLSDCDGVHVVCSPDDAAVITVYRNRDFRSLREGRRSRSFRGTRRATWGRRG